MTSKRKEQNALPTAPKKDWSNGLPSKYVQSHVIIFMHHWNAISSSEVQHDILTNMFYKDVSAHLWSNIKLNSSYHFYLFDANINLLIGYFVIRNLSLLSRKQAHIPKFWNAFYFSQLYLDRFESKVPPKSNRNNFHGLFELSSPICCADSMSSSLQKA